jgi:hypothetical protein
LLDQPAISLAGGGKVRLGLEAKQVARGNAILVYALLEGNQWRAGGEQSLGPLRIQFVPFGASHVAAVEKRVSAARSPRWDKAQRLLFATTIQPFAFWDLDKDRAVWPEKFRLALRGPDNALVASAIVTPTGNQEQPWLVFGAPAEPKSWTSPQMDLVQAFFGMRGLHPATPHCNGSHSILVDNDDIRRTRALPRWTFVEPDGGLSLRADVRSLRVKSNKALCLSWPGDRLLHRLWINGRPFAPKEKIKAYGINRTGALVFGTRLDIDWEFDPARIQARKGDRVGVQVLYCPDGWRFHDEYASHIGTHRIGDPSVRLPQLSNRVEFTIE